MGINETSSSITREIWKYKAFDGSDEPFLFRIDSTLNSAALTLIKGSIVKVSSYFPIYFNYGESNDTRCAIVARSFEVVGRQALPLGVTTAVGTKSRVVKVKSETTRKRKKTGPAATAQEPSTQNLASKPSCNGELCTKCGVAFDACLSELIPPRSISLPLVARDCVFATMPVNDMANHHKRFLLYYYYATTVYQFRGSGNRVDLPECIIYAIRDIYHDEMIEVTTNMHKTTLIYVLWILIFFDCWEVVCVSQKTKQGAILVIDTQHMSCRPCLLHLYLHTSRSRLSTRCPIFSSRSLPPVASALLVHNIVLL